MALRDPRPRCGKCQTHVDKIKKHGLCPPCSDALDVWMSEGSPRRDPAQPTLADAKRPRRARDR